MKKTRPIQKMLALVLCMAMLSALFIPTVSAEELAQDGDYYLISTEADLKKITDGTTAKYKLTKNITLTEAWTPIASFGGELDGNGFGIYNLTFDSASTSNIAFIQSTVTGAVIKNLTLEGTISVESDGSGYFAAFVGSAGGQTTISDCFSYVDITATCSAVTYSAAFIAQIDGATEVNATDGTKVSNCVNYGTITLTFPAQKETSSIGGIVGAVGNDTLTISDCYNFGELALKGTIAKSYGKLYVAGILGTVIANSSDTITIARCVNYAQLSSAARFVGGIVGSSFLGKNIKVDVIMVVEYCSNFGTLFATHNSGSGVMVGGIISDDYFCSRVEYCYNGAAIVSCDTNDYADSGYGGIIGALQTSTYRDLTNVSYENCFTVSFDVPDTYGGDIMFGLYKRATNSTTIPNGTITNCGVLDNNVDTVLGYLNTRLEKGNEVFCKNEDGEIEPVGILSKANTTVYASQIKTDTDSYAVRFVSAISSLRFSAVGYQITVTGTMIDEEQLEQTVNKSADLSGTTVYSAIYETTETENERVDAPDGCAFYTATIDGISFDKYEALTFEVTPYVVVGEKTVTGTTVTFTFQDGEVVR